MRGDIKGTGKVGTADDLMNSLYFGAKVDTTNPDSWACDINGTGAIDSADLQALYIGSLYSKPLIADYYNNWTYHKVDDTSGYWTTEIAINGLKTTSDAIVNIGNDEGIFYKSELSDGAIRFYATRPPIAEVPATITFKSGTGVITTSYESAKFHAATHSKDGADSITPESIGALSLSGGTMTGPLVLSGDPAEDLEAATKQYVDNHMAYESGLPEKPSTPIADGQEIPYTWEEINAITLAGKAQEYFSLGATKLVNLSTAVLGANAATMMVIGFNQDGENTTTFQTKGTLPTDTSFGSNAVWIGSTVRTQCQNFYNACEAKNFIKTVSKGTCLDQVSGKNGTATYNDETVWIPSETEIGLDKYSSLTKSNSTTSNSECTKGYNATYSYYTSDTTRIKYQMNANGSLTTTAIWHWERSRYYGYSNWPCIVRSDGQPDRRDATGRNGLAPAFVIGNGTSPDKITQDGEDITDKVKGLITSDTVLYTPQTLTDEQKTQARTNINAAPGGFGLGANGWPYVYTVLTADTIDSVNRSGLYVYDDNNISIDTGLGNYGGSGLLLHLAHTIAHSYDAKQIFYPRAGMKNTYLERVKDTDKGWQPWEYVNPPMESGVEYRTTERFWKRPVYYKIVDCGQIVDNKQVEHGIANMRDCIFCQGLRGAMPMPSISNNDLSDPWSYYVADVNRTKITLACGTTAAGGNCHVILKYTKTTD